jgi:hypothetical protein
MPLIIRIDVDRPYGRQPWWRHVTSRLSSDLYFPTIGALGYLQELKTMLKWLNESNARAYVFFRRCTLPSRPVLELVDAGHHEIGLHLENSRTFETFANEAEALERHIGRPVRSFSKHGSGGAKYGLHHYPAYEPQKYLDWAERGRMNVFLGNLEDPTMRAEVTGRLAFFPAAFWLEPHWRDTERFSVDWLLNRAQRQDIVLLVHPENVLAEPALVTDFKTLICSLESKIL